MLVYWTLGENRSFLGENGLLDIPLGENVTLNAAYAFTY